LQATNSNKQWRQDIFAQKDGTRVLSDTWRTTIKPNQVLNLSNGKNEREDD